MKKHDYKSCRPIIVWRRWPSNNFRKMQGEPMLRYKQLEKVARRQLIRPLARKNKHAGLRASIVIIDEMHEYGGYNNGSKI